MITQWAMTFFNTENPQLKIREVQPTDKWQFIPFLKPLKLDVATLVKLSKAADPWSSSLAVYYDSNSVLWINGMIDQAIHSQSYMIFEQDKKPEQPGYFRATINGIGNISVMTEYDLIANLKQEHLITDFVRVFQSGPIGEIIKKLAKCVNRKVIDYVKEFYPHEDHTDWDTFKLILCRTTISRLLNQIKRYNHGGAILFTNEETENLDIKYKIEYDRIAASMSNIINVKVALSQFEVESIALDIPAAFYELQAKKRSAANELKGAIRFVASQSCVDGLVLVDFSLIVKGFGVVIKNEVAPEYVYFSDKTSVFERKLVMQRADKFGTRHRSMFAYCYNHAGSLGFVISQDGDIRAVTKVNDKLIVWDNIQTQKTIRSMFFKRTTPSKS